MQGRWNTDKPFDVLIATDVCSNVVCCLQQHRGWQMRANFIVIALVVAFGFACIADLYWNGGSYTRMVIHSLGLVVTALVNNW